MVEAMQEQTPNFFTKFPKNLRYHICFEERRMGKISRFSKRHLLCTLKKAENVTLSKKHYNLLVESCSKIQKRGKGYNVACLNSISSSLIHTTSLLELK